MHTKEIGLQEKLAFAQDTARRAGRLLMRFYDRGAHNYQIVRDDGSLITPLGIASSHLINGSIEEHDLTASIISEENSVTKGGNRSWVVDAGNRSEKPEIASVLIGYVEDNTPLMGVMYSVKNGMMISSERGGIPLLSMRKSHLPTLLSIDKSRGLNDGEVMIGPDDKWHLESKQAGDFIERRGIKLNDLVHGSTRRLAMVALDGAVGAISPESKPWHVCAIEPAIVAAGGKVTDLRGRPIDYSNPQHRGAIASNGSEEVHEALTAIGRNILELG